MTDLLIRDVPDDIVAALDADASRLGLSRSEYLRRTLAQAVARTGHIELTIDDLARVAEVFADLGDDDVMREAWR
jgi:hypothetical protein